MSQRQWKNLLQFLGLGSLAYGIYTVWAEYQIYAGINSGLNAFAQEQGVTGLDNMFMGAMDAFGYSLGDMLLRSPWIWAGIALVIAPYLVGLGGPSRQNPIAPSDDVELFVNCRECGKAVLEKAPFCPHCGAAR